MSNDINGVNSHLSEHTHDSQTKAVKDVNEATDSQSNQGTSAEDDKIVLTDLASHLISLENKLSRQPEVDQDHVNRIRNALDQGNYKVNPDRIANKMMGFEKDL